MHSESRNKDPVMMSHANNSVGSIVNAQIYGLLMCKCNMVELTGLFAIVFATALALGHAPEAFHFKQNWMRYSTDLRQCLGHGVITMFP